MRPAAKTKFPRRAALFGVAMPRTAILRFLLTRKGPAASIIAAMKRGILFDMDGVLLDSAPIHLEGWRQWGEENGMVIAKDFFRDQFGKANAQILPVLFGRPLSDEEIERHAARKEALYRRALAGRAQALPGVIPLIQSLHRAGWTIAIASSGPRANVEMVIQELDLGPYLSAFTCAEEVRCGKPDPEVFTLAAAKINLPPDRCLVAEDSIHGIQAAHAAGMKCLAITTTYPRPILLESGADRVIESFEQFTAQDAAAMLDGSEE